MNLFRFLSLFLLAAVAATHAQETPPADDPPASPAEPVWEATVVTLPAGAPAPKALVKSVDAQAGTFVFDWLDADGKATDSGNSIGRFTPLDPVAFPSTAVLAAAIHTPAAAAAPVGVWTTLTFLERFTDTEKLAIFTSTDVQVVVARSTALAAQDIRTDDPRTAAIMALFVAKGLITPERKTAVLTP